MIISFLFSFVIYTGINNELERIKHEQERRLSYDRNMYAMPSRVGAPLIDLTLINTAQERLRLILLLVNLGILGISGVAAYFLSGRTLQPIKQMVEEQNRFITDASHELRTPLTALRSEIEVNLRDKDLNVKDAKELLKSNLEEVINLQSLSDQLMQLAQYQKKNGSIQMENISVQEVLKNAVSKLNNISKLKKIKLDNNVKDYRVFGNKQILIELFITLLDNAVKYSPQKTTITITSKKANNVVSIFIKDQGVGIDSKDLPFIFDRFYRADKSRSKEISGYGLGLSIAKKIVDLHQGAIHVESKVNKGSTFIIQLPTS